MLKLSLNTLIIGQKFVFLPKCQSTNAEAHQILAQKPPEGTCIFTPNQTAGRGQQGNIWESESAQNIALSVILKPSFLEIRDQFYLNLAVSLAIQKSLQKFLPSKGVQIKWPNDIMSDNKKICGILIENVLRGASLNYSIVGIGINVNQKTFSYPQASSLANLLGEELALELVLQEVIPALEMEYFRLRKNPHQVESLKKEYLENLFGYEAWRDYRAKGEYFRAKIIDIDLEKGGQLVLQNERGEMKHYDFKQIEYQY